MTAVATPPSFANISRPTWGMNGGSSLHSMNQNSHTSEDSRGMFTPRKTLQRTNSSSSVSSNSSTGSTGTVGAQHNGGAPQTNGASSSNGSEQWNNRKRGQPKSQWNQSQSVSKTDSSGPEYSRIPVSRPAQSGPNGASSLHQAPMLLGPQTQNGGGPQPRPMGESIPLGQPVLYLLSLNGTFERKTISVPFYPDTLRIGRQTNARTVPTPVNGYFDSKVLSRQHAEIYADRAGKIWIRDVKSSNGTFVNGTRLSQENRESEPHELQTQDHLELGIDIVNEDQKSVVHHKVAAKVEHAGFLNPAHSLMDMNFGDLDPSGGGQMMLPPMSGVPARGRTGSQASIGTNGRMAPTPGMGVAQANGIMPGRAVWLSQPSTEAIVKKLHQEMRSAKLQANDLQRTAHFLGSLMSKEEVKNSDRSEPSDGPKQQHAVNGGSGSFRVEGSKTRFSDPPAPPPQQPLPEKPDVAASRPNGEVVPSLRRGPTERPRSHTSQNTSPIRQDNNLSQIIQLTETLNLAKKEADHQTARIRDLEEMVQRERDARQSAEDLVRKLEDAVVVARGANGSIGGSVGKGDEETLLATTFEPPTTDAPSTSSTADSSAAESAPATGAEGTPSMDETTIQLQTRLDAIVREMRELRDQLDEERRRAERAEAERDGDRRTLADMVAQIRQRDTEIERLAAAAAARQRSRSRSTAATAGLGARGRSRNGNSPISAAARVVGAFPETPTTMTPNGSTLGSVVGDNLDAATASLSSGDADSDDKSQAGPDGQPTLSRANTITPMTSALAPRGRKDNATVQAAAPYASIIGVVLLGMGLMAWINGWQPQPARLDR